MPVAETPRLRLRPFTPADVPAMAAIFADPEVMRHVGAGPIHDRTSVARMLSDYADHHAEYGWSVWAVEERATATVIGDAGLWPHELDEVELGYTLARAAWGRGYATEAATACVEVAARCGIERLVALVDLDHAASQRVLGKVGMRRDGSRSAYGREHAVYRLP